MISDSGLLFLGHPVYIIELITSSTFYKKAEEHNDIEGSRKCRTRKRRTGILTDCRTILSS